MKLIGVLIGLLLLSNLMGQQPEKVYSITMELQEESWYKTQAELWKKEVNKNKKNANAWYNYYAAVRALKNISWKDSSLQNKYFKQCEEIVEAAYEAVPKSFEANHLKWWHSSFDNPATDYLLKAYEIDPSDSRTYSDLMLHYYMQFDASNFEKFAKLEYQSGDMPGGTYNWAYNLLAGLAPHAIIFSAGDNDTFLPWIIQASKEYRKDVTVINTSLMTLDSYRDKLFEKIGLPVLEDRLQESKTEEEYLTKINRIKQAVFSNTIGRPVYVSGTAIEQFEEEYGDYLYMTGLAYRYADKPFDNLAIIKRNVEKRYLIDGLKASFSFHPLDKKTKQFNAFYLPSFMKLYCHYKESEELLKAAQIKSLMLSIASGTPQEKEINEWLVNKG